MSKENRSFGEYFDAQRIRIEKAMQNKNTELHKAWREDYDKRQRVRDLAGLREEDEEEMEQIHETPSSTFSSKIQ